tara:strand:+ start:375 stop:776 length:402 start_codon:yes stop_codon:yes gene_type:complete
MINFKELYDNVSERVIRKLDPAKQRERRRKTKVRMTKLMKNPAHQKKLERARIKIPNQAKISVIARKKAKKIVLDKFYPKYNEMSMQARIKVDQIVAMKYGAMIEKIAKKQEPKVKKDQIAKVKQAKDARRNA